jgi:LDH2 family malate/lactate/ureidoglycolate dehydrogenase
MTAAAANGVGVASVRNSHHIGALGFYARTIARSGLIAIVTTTTRTVAVVPTRGAEPKLGTNPIAIAAPSLSGEPLMIDMSTATVAINKVKVHALKQQPIPEGWVMDEAGRPITDSAIAMDYLRNRPVGGVTPLGGTALLSSHKGYGLGVAVQLLAATLGGGAYSAMRTPGDKERTGHTAVAIDPARFREDGGFLADVQAIAEDLRSTRAADPALPVLAPGDPEVTTAAQRTRDGIPLPASLVEQLRVLCAESGAEFALREGDHA